MAVLISVLLSTGANTAAAHPGQRIEVWSSQSFSEPFGNDRPVELYFRSEEYGYLTLYQVTPGGVVEILYPQPHHRWQMLRPGRIYSLSELADDVCLDYPGADGYAYIGVVVTRHPIPLVSWIDQAFYEQGLIVGRVPGSRVRLDFELIIGNVEADVRFRLGARSAVSFALIPVCVRPRLLLYQPIPRHYYRPPRFYYGGRYHVERPRAPDRPRYEPRPFHRRSPELPSNPRRGIQQRDDPAPSPRNESRTEVKTPRSRREAKPAPEARKREVERQPTKQREQPKSESAKKPPTRRRN